MKLKGQVAVITGASGGFGREIAMQMAKEGAKIGINDVDDKGIQETLANLKGRGGEGLALKCDVGDVKQVEAMFNRIQSVWGTVDILVNNAGFVFKEGWEDYIELTNTASSKAGNEIMNTGKLQESMKILSSFKDEWWHDTLNVILNGTFYCTREALKIMEKKRRGKIINIASVNGYIGGTIVPAYSAAKGGVIALTKSVAKDVIGSGIIVNAVAPGYCDTPLLGPMDEEMSRALTSQIPLGRLGKPEEIASLVVYLASDDANYIVGQVISPNGGLVI